MDDIVRQAMAKWPDVPHCFGWLGLDHRGDWYLRDDATQKAGSFASGVAGSKGSRLSHEKLIDFIQRNYAADTNGCWYFQNGPQRVYVELQVSPWIWRVDEVGGIQSHTGLKTECTDCYVDEHGHLYLQTPLGVGLVHTADMVHAATLIGVGRWQPREVLSQSVPSQFGFVRSPIVNRTKP
jgi:hypothetical protein